MADISGRSRRRRRYLECSLRKLVDHREHLASCKVWEVSPTRELKKHTRHLPNEDQSALHTYTARRLEKLRAARDSQCNLISSTEEPNSVPPTLLHMYAHNHAPGTRCSLAWTLLACAATRSEQHIVAFVKETTSSDRPRQKVSGLRGLG